MSKDKIKELLKNKYIDIFIIILINIIFFCTFNYLYQPKYEQVDDFIIMNLISKMDGNYSIYGIHMHPIICIIIIGLFKTGININWYTIFLLFMQFISFTTIGTVFLKKNRKLGIIIYLTFIMIFYSRMLRFIQYTSTASLVLTAGFILLMYSIDNIKEKRNLFIGLALTLIVIGCMIRFDTIIIAIPFIIIYFAYKYITNKNLKELKTLLILIILVLIVKISFFIIYNLNPVYKDFLKFNDVRTYFHDYNWTSYAGNRQMFENSNWSQNDRDILYGYCFGDEEFFNTETLNILKQNNNSEDNILLKLINTLTGFIQAINDGYYKYAIILLLVLIIYNNISNTKDIKKLLLINIILIAIVGIHMLFIYLGRPMFRVVISIYMIGIAGIIYFLINRNIKIKESSSKFLIIAICILFLFSYTETKKVSGNYNRDYYKSYKEVIEYANSHKENAYLYTLVLHSRFLAYSVYEKIPDDTFSNIRPLGDWDTYTQNYYDFKERYKLDNLITDLYKKDNVYLIAGHVIWGEPYEDYLNIIIKYIKEHYNIDVEAEIEKEFKNNIKIYKLHRLEI